jgi:hypothetical protein
MLKELRARFNANGSPPPYKDEGTCIFTDLDAHAYSLFRSGVPLRRIVSITTPDGLVFGRYFSEMEVETVL